MLGLISADSQSTTFSFLIQNLSILSISTLLILPKSTLEHTVCYTFPHPTPSLKITPNMSIVSMHNSAWLLSIDGIYPLRNVDCSNYLLS